MIDVGTGDGRAVLETAARMPTTLVLGLDASAASMAEASRRAAGPARRGGMTNAAFVLAAAERPPAELVGLADVVTVRFPWGSLLRGVVGGEPPVAAGVAALVDDHGEIELLLAPAARDGLDDVPTDPARLADAAARTFEGFGFALLEGRTATTGELMASGSTWARRLGVARTRGSANDARDRSSGVADRAATFVRLARTRHR